MRTRRPCLTPRWLVASCALLAAGAASSLPTDADDLRTVRVPVGAIMTSAEGRILAVDPGGAVLTAWEEEGTLLGRFPIPSPPSRPGPIGVAARGDEVLVAYPADTEGDIDGILLDLRSGSELGRFTVGQYPSRLSAAPDGWLFERLQPGEAPVLTVVGNDGRTLRVLDLPPGLVDRATRAFGDASVAFVRPIAVGREVWAVPSLAYELWSLSGNRDWRRLEVPPCLAVAARKVVGDVARRRMQEQADQAPDAERRHLEERLEWTRRMNIRVSSYVTAARTVSARDGLVAVLTEPFPEQSDDGCRLDVWRTADARLLAAVPVPGVCPSFVGLVRGGAWIRQRDRLTLLAIAPRPPGDPCGP